MEWQTLIVVLGALSVPVLILGFITIGELLLPLARRAPELVEATRGSADAIPAPDQAVSDQAIQRIGSNSEKAVTDAGSAPQPTDGRGT